MDTVELQEALTRRRIKTTIILSSIVFVLLIALLALNPFVIVTAGHRGIVLTWGAVSDRILSEGIHWRTPVAQKVKKIDIRVQKEQVEAHAASKDLQTVSSEVALNFSLDPQRVNILWREIGPDYRDRLIAPAIQEIVKAVTAKYTAEELITKRSEVGDAITTLLKERLATSYITVEQLSIVNFNFSGSFNAAIEAKQTAVQEALKAENDLRTIKIQAEQRVAQAKAEAEAIRIQAQALIENPRLVELEAVRKWNGVLPYFSGSGVVPFINVTPK